MGCNVGPNQAARHFVGEVSPHMISRANRRHVTVEKLEAATRELAELYLRLDLPRVWGDGKSVAADGTQYDFYDQNLLRSEERRVGKDVSVRVDLGGSRIIKKKKKRQR